MNTAAHARAVLASSISNTMQATFAAYRTHVENLEEQAMRDGAVCGYAELDGEGESVIEVNFPIAFAEKPLFTAGLELADNVWLKWTSFPQWSATVGAWTTSPADGEPLYTGAIIGAVVSGAARSILHYRFQARSFTSPTGASALNLDSIL